MIYDTIEKNGKTYHKVCEVNKLENNKLEKIEFEDYDEQIVIFKHEGNFSCLTNICPHMREPKMHEGTLRKGIISCPKHGWRFNTKSGQNQNKKIGTKDLKSYDIFEQDGFIYVEKPEIDEPKWKF